MPTRLFIACLGFTGCVFVAGCSIFGGAAPAIEPVASLQLSTAPTVASTNVFVGRVVTPTGQAVTDARVVYWSEHQTLTNSVNEMGYFQTQPLTPGRWSARAENVRFAPSHVVDFVVGGSQPLPMVLFPLHQGGVLRVQLRDVNRNPVRHATVEVLAGEGYRTTLLDAGAGVYECPQSLAQGELTVRATSKGLSTVENHTKITAGQVTQLELTLAPAQALQTKP